MVCLALAVIIPFYARPSSTISFIDILSGDILSRASRIRRAISRCLTISASVTAEYWRGAIFFLFRKHVLQGLLNPSQTSFLVCSNGDLSFKNKYINIRYIEQWFNILQITWRMGEVCEQEIKKVAARDIVQSRLAPAHSGRWTRYSQLWNEKQFFWKEIIL